MGETLAGIIVRLRDMLSWPQGWNCYDADPLNPAAVSYAEVWVTEIFAHDGSLLLDINITSDGVGNVVFEWWNKEKKITLYLYNRLQIEYLRIWGADVNAEMDDGQITSLHDFIQLKQWLSDDQV